VYDSQNSNSSYNSQTNSPAASYIRFTFDRRRFLGSVQSRTDDDDAATPLPLLYFILVSQVVDLRGVGAIDPLGTGDFFFVPIFERVP
jgi:hypothetical protein